MSQTLFSCNGGDVVLPGNESVLVSGIDGGNLIVNPPRDVWERHELTRSELMQWSALVAATGRAMLEVLPQLEGGCINYWEAGNWALNEDAAPKGPKTARESRRVHLHLLGRSPGATHPSWKWGEAPQFPRFADRLAWASGFERLTSAECVPIVTRIETLLKNVYAFEQSQIRPWSPCSTCGYPTTDSHSSVRESRGSCLTQRAD